MSKALVICIDGTWNAPGQTDKDPVGGDEVGTDTNVSRTWSALTGETLDHERPYGTIASLIRQEGCAIYLNGVGSMGNKLGKLYEGASGTGTSERIRDAYRFIAERWVAGDKIYGFGFSRGAFAVRSLIGFIYAVGLPKKVSLTKEEELADLYDSYRSKSVKNSMPRWHRPCDVEFLGIWDTVGALAFGDSFNDYHMVSPPNVRHVFHALALDEIRSQFNPLFYECSGQCNIVETWFSGAHSNVGGGYSDTNLSNIALFWILKKAKEKGLELDLPSITGWYGESVGGVRRPSYEEFWGDIPLLGRVVEQFRLHQQRRVGISSQLLHESILDAITASNGAYQPAANAVIGELQNRIEPWGI